MKSKYLSPELEIIKFDFTKILLDVSTPVPSEIPGGDDGPDLDLDS